MVPSRRRFPILAVMTMIVFLVFPIRCPGESPSSEETFTGWVVARQLMSRTGAQDAFRQLSAMGTRSLPTIRRLLGGRNLRMLRAGLDLADALGTSAERLTPELARILGDRRLGGLRVRAARMLGRCGSLSRETLPALLGSLTEGNRNLRVAAAEAFLDVWSRGLSGLPDWRAMLTDRKNPVRIMILQGLQEWGPALHPVVPLIASYAREGRVDGPRALGMALPRMVPGGGILLDALVGLAIPPSRKEGIDPDTPAFEEQVVAANKAEEVSSFEDIPADEEEEPLPFEENPAVEPESGN